MSTERDELADDIPRVTVGSGYYSTTIGYDEAREIADHLIELGYRKPRTVTTAAELDALPPRSVVLDSDPEVLEKSADGEVWLIPGTLGEFSASNIGLPATVLYEPPR